MDGVGNLLFAICLVPVFVFGFAIIGGLINQLGKPGKKDE